MWYMVLPQRSRSLGLFVEPGLVSFPVGGGSMTRLSPLATKRSTLSSSLQVSFWAYT